MSDMHNIAHTDRDERLQNVRRGRTALAARLGVTKETLSRRLRTLSDRGCIRVARREITIVDRARLALITV